MVGQPGQPGHFSVVRLREGQSMDSGLARSNQLAAGLVGTALPNGAAYMLFGGQHGVCATGIEA